MALNSRYEQPIKYGSPGSVIIRMRGITKVFRTPAGEMTVLKGIDVDVAQGQFISVVGRSGSGKSTLVNMLTGIDHPTSGTVEVGGAQIHQMPESQMAVWRGKNLGIVFQFYQLLPMLTLVENVMLPMDFCNMFPPAHREERALALLERVGLEKMAYKLPGAVSGGQQQSAAVARALANDPPVLIADEPTGNLDSRTAANVMELFEEMTAQGKTILMVTHDRSLAMRTSRILLISDGELVNESISAAFPEASHSALLRLSKLASNLQLTPGLPLPKPQAPVAYLVQDGSLIHLSSAGPQTITSGSWFIPRNGAAQRIAAGDQGAVLLMLPEDEIRPYLPAGSYMAKNEPGRNRKLQSWFRRRP